MSAHPAADIHRVDIRSEAVVGTPAVADILEAVTRAAAAMAAIVNFPQQVFHAVQLLACCRFDVASELM
jgi:hypothetical protein